MPTQNMEIGKADIPEESFDQLGFGKYTDGVAKFVGSCDTPMTISIRGEWGTGKTSFLKQVDSQLQESDKYITMWFNTWQFAESGFQENMISAIIVSLVGQLENLIKKTAWNGDSANRDAEAARKSRLLSFAFHIASLGLNASTIVAPQLSPIAGPLANMCDTASGFPDTIGDGKRDTYTSGNVSEKKADQVYSGLQQVLQTRDSIQEQINDALKILGKERLVIFIDDLDRLNPSIAVSLLEGLKIFFDCENCVFLLAIDDSVVYTGINQKYGLGEDSDRKEADEKKAKMFFDKIVRGIIRMCGDVGASAYTPFLSLLDYKSSDADIRGKGLHVSGACTLAAGICA